MGTSSLFYFPGKIIPSRFKEEDFRRIELEINEMFQGISSAQKNIIDDSVIFDFINMGACLTFPIISEHLKTLNNQLTNRLSELGVLTNDNQIIKKPGKTYISNYKVLSSFFTEWAQKEGFNRGGKVLPVSSTENLMLFQQGAFIKVPQFINKGINKGRNEFLASNAESLDEKYTKLPSETLILTGIVPTRLFQEMLALGYIFKDVGAGPAHGEFTHMLALYIIVEENKKNPFLNNKPEVLYKLLGSYPYVISKSSADVQFIWNIIFDNSLVPFDNDHIYTMPEKLNSLLLGEDNNGRVNPSFFCDISVLSQIITGRYEKRENELNTQEKLNEKYGKAPGLVWNKHLFFPNKNSKTRQEVNDELSDDNSGPDFGLD